MKRSNILLVSLFAALFLIPVFIYTVYTITQDNSYIGIPEKFKVVVINDPALQPEDIEIDTSEASDYPYKELNTVNQRSFLYYQGEKQYLPNISLKNDSTIVVNGIKEGNEKNKKLTFHIHLIDLNAVYLNGVNIWPE